MQVAVLTDPCGKTPCSTLDEISKEINRYFISSEQMEQQFETVCETVAKNLNLALYVYYDTFIFSNNHYLSDFAIERLHNQMEEDND